MDNLKTGTFIRERRKEKGLTQKDLARQLHVTDRAVSKWERGLCAPDISLLEPLAEMLEVSIVELIEGERINHSETEAAAKTVINYSRQEIKRRKKTLSRKYMILAAALLFLLITVCSFFLWQRGAFSVIDKRVSPDGSACAMVYDKALNGKRFSVADGISLIIDLGDHAELRSTYGDCDYRGFWWSPDGEKFVLALEDYHGGSYLELAFLEYGSSKNLTAYLSMGVERAELAKNGWKNEMGWPDIEYQFLQWSKDSEAILIYYAFGDQDGALHEGYFWYHCETGEVTAVLELETY